MAKRPTVTTISSGFASNTQLNSNFTAIRNAFDNTLSLDGSSPNAMQADLDLNGNALLNVGNINADNLTLNGQTVTELSSVPEWRSAWITGRSYVKNDLVSEAGNAYICLVAHTSGTFSTDLSAAKWELFAAKGAAGAGTGDMIGANNLSDVTNPATARNNIGAQAADAELTAIAGLSTNGFIIKTGAGTALTRVLLAGTGITVTNGGGISGEPTVSATLASQAQAEAGTDNTTLMTPLRAYQAISTLSRYTRYELFTASGTFNTPAGVTEGYVVLVGGGGGGSGSSQVSVGAGGRGGLGGVAAGVLSFSGAMAVTIGAGGAGTNTSANGSAGGSSTFSTLTATGGAGGVYNGSGVGTNGASGSGSGTGILLNSTAGSTFFDYSIITVCVPALIRVIEESNTSSTLNTAATTYSFGGAYSAGAGGSGETLITANNASGGVGGAAYIFY